MSKIIAYINTIVNIKLMSKMNNNINSKILIK